MTEKYFRWSTEQDEIVPSSLVIRPSCVSMSFFLWCLSGYLLLLLSAGKVLAVEEAAKAIVPESNPVPDSTESNPGHPWSVRSLPLRSGDELDIHVFGTGQPGPLLIWLVNQYAEMTTPQRIIEELVARGATVWRVDLLESLFLQRSPSVIRALDGEPVAALLEAAVRERTGPVAVVASDRMAVPALRGLHHWQGQTNDLGPVAGSILFFPNLYRGTPVAGEVPELLGIVSATNMPVAILQPSLGNSRERLPELLRSLHRAGSPAYVRMVPGVPDYYILYSESGRNRALETLGATSMPQELRTAIEQTPSQMLELVRLLDRSPRPRSHLVVDRARERPFAPAYGLISRPPRIQHPYSLIDTQGERHHSEQNLGRVTLVNFWATWCPPCVHEIPSMNRLASRYSEDEFAIVSINFREDPRHIQSFMRRVAVDFPVLLDHDGRISSEWGVFAFPSSFLVDRSGQIRYSVNTAIEWDTAEVRAVIDELRSEVDDRILLEEKTDDR